MNFDDSVKIAKIGDRIESQTNASIVPNSQEFYVGKQTYKLALDNISIEKLKKDVAVVKSFKLETIKNGPNVELWLKFSPTSIQYNFTSECYKSIIDTFFVIEHANLFDDIEIEKELYEKTSDLTESDDMTVDNEVDNVSHVDSVNSNVLPKWTIDDLYQQLRETHKASKSLDKYRNEIVEHNDLRPLLTEHQINGVKWMLHRERIQAYYCSGFQEIKRRWFDSSDTTKFYYNPVTARLMINRNDDIPIPSGGILADAMGLGKTVQILDLMLINKRVLKQNQNDRYLANNERKNKTSQQLRCLCLCTRRENTVTCVRCQMLQHRKCVSQKNSIITPDEIYICPHCWQGEQPIKAKTTIVVSPASIKMQWQEEVLKHIDAENLKILIYDGLKTSVAKWINPMELASYDIILIDYTTLQSEFDYIDKNPSRRLVQPSYYIQTKSPLLYVNWWRVCLDEAQMVSSDISKQARLVARLSAVHRWAVTGTPIQESIDDIHGLIKFLGCSPYDDRQQWDFVKNELQRRNNFKPILGVLKPIMWRTCKSKNDMIDDMDIPKQTEVIHMVQMTDLEKYHYKTVHKKCGDEFRLRSQKYDANRQLATLDRASLNKLLEPFRVIRHDCSTPQIKHASEKILNLDDLLQYLLKKNRTEAEAELRAIGWSLNGIAANGKSSDKIGNVETAKKYQHVLKLEKVYNGKVTLDLLVRIHAIHNLLLIDSSISAKERMAYEADLIKFQSKYLERTVKLMENCQTKLDTWNKNITSMKKNVTVHTQTWMTDALNGNSTKVLNEIRKQVEPRYLKKSDGVLHVTSLVKSWMDNMFKEREEVQNLFDELRLISDNFKPIAESQKKTSEKLTTFLNHATECHMRTNSSDPLTLTEPSQKRPKFQSCQLCDLKNKLDSYKCFIYQKNIIHLKNTDNQEKTTRISWKTPFQENILKTIVRYMRKLGMDTNDGKITMQLIEALRSEFMEYNQLLVEINKTVEAYDEIDKSKSNIKLFHPMTASRDISMKDHLGLIKYSLSFTIAKENAEKKLHQLIGRLQYFDHLQKDKNVEDCPICLSPPEDVYGLLECGHYICATCISQFLNDFQCPICRHKQLKSELYYASVLSETRFTNCSSKIEKIVQTIFDLKHKEPEVKIVIFSQSTDTLVALQYGLNSTGISYRHNVNVFHQTIKDFKDPNLGVTCLLLPLSLGSNGLNLIEATHVFLVEPIMNPGEEIQATSRIHRIGQTKETYVHRFIVQNTIEEAIHEIISNHGNEFWSSKMFTMTNLIELFASNKNLSTDN